MFSCFPLKVTSYTIYRDGRKMTTQGPSNIAAPHHVKRGTIHIFIPSFDGDCNYYEYAKWEREVEKELLSINNLSEHERLRAITSAFTGYALTWWKFR